MLGTLLMAAVGRPRTTLLSWVGLCAVASFGIIDLRVETSTDSILSRADPAWAYYRESVARFGGDEIIVVAFEAREPFAPDALEEVRRLTRETRDISGVRRVDSLATVANIRVRSDDSLDLDPLLTRQMLETASPAELAKAAFADRIAPGALVSANGRVFAVNVLLRDLGADYDEVAVAGVRDAIGSLDAWITGGPVFRTETNRRMQREILTFVPITVCVVGLLLFAIFRSLRAVWIPLGTSALGIWVMFGALGALDTPLTISTMILPSVLLALGSAYVMHILVVASAESDVDVGTRIAEVARPIALSGLTTAIGFVSMAMVRIDSIQYLGGFGAIGVLAVLAAALSAAPACLQLWPLPVQKPRLSVWIRGELAGGLLRAAVNRRQLILGSWVAVALASAFGATQIEVETDVTRWFPRGTAVREAYEEVRERLSGISPMNVVIHSEGGEPVDTPRVIEAIDGLDSYLEDRPEVGTVLSVADPLRQLHGGFTGDAALPLPRDGAQIAQYLLILESVEHLWDVLAADRRSANVMLRANDNGSEDLLALAREAEGWWRENGPAGFSARTTGIMFEYARAEDEIAYGQIRGLALALGVIGVLLFAIFRRLSVASWALLASALPIGTAFGAMGLLGIPLDAGTVSVGCLALGIAVDDIIHLVAGYQLRRTQAEAPAAALGGTFDALLPPLVYTTLVVSAGFLVLGVSGFLIIRSLGFLTAGLMVLCLIADVTLLAVLLIWRRKIA